MSLSSLSICLSESRRDAIHNNYSCRYRGELGAQHVLWCDNAVVEEVFKHRYYNANTIQVRALHFSEV